MKEQIFIDTNAFFYFLSQEKGKGDVVMRLLDDNQYILCTNVLVLNELKFKLLWGEAALKLNTTNKYTILNHIKNDKKLRQEVYARYLLFFVNIRSKVHIYEIEEQEEVLSCALSEQYGLLPTDASILATMQQYGIVKILTSDLDFKKIKEIQAIEP
ncbi:PIN domain-containing protein [Candidatus Woesearchaeota archaeon]|nr:PIN domain-containing protein [Candidatus Woesearchaeota archaeon]